jgi:hypothetical protein
VPSSLPGPLQFDSAYDNINIGVVIFRGLQGNSGGGFGSALQLKCIAGLEIAPNPNASVRIFAEAAAPFEPRALEAYYTLCLELKDAYPASFNSLQSILDAISSAASKVWNVFEPALSKSASQLVESGTSALIRGMGGLTGARRPSVPRVTYKATGAAPARSASVSSRRSVSKPPPMTKSAKRRAKVQTRAR